LNKTSALCVAILVDNSHLTREYRLKKPFKLRIPPPNGLTKSAGGDGRRVFERLCEEARIDTHAAGKSHPTRGGDHLEGISDRQPWRRFTLRRSR
jgi:hypothetical protein